MRTIIHIEKHTSGQKSNCIGLYRDEKVHIWGGIGIVVCHCHPKYELFSPEIGVVALCQAKNRNSLHGFLKVHFMTLLGEDNPFLHRKQRLSCVATATATTLLVASSIAQGARGLGTGVAAGLTLLGT